MYLDPKKLQVFVAIVEEGSFTAAAARLNMAQPWLSLQLKQLEEMIETPLIERGKGRIIKLTPAGRDILPVAKKVVAACGEATQEMNALRARKHGQIMLGLDPITLYITERNLLIAQFMARFPKSELKIVSGNPSQLFRALDNGELDLILTSEPGPSDFEMLPLYQKQLCLMVPKASDQLARARRGDLAGMSILTLPDSYHPGMFSWLRTSLAAADVHWTECPETSFPALIHYASMLGIVTLSPDLSEAMPEIAREMELVSITGTPLEVRWSLMRRSNRRHKASDRLWALAAESALGRVNKPTATASPYDAPGVARAPQIRSSP